MVFRAEVVPGLSGYDAYISEISLGFCPFIIPSTNAGAMFTSVYSISEDCDQVEAAIFYLGLIHTEILRKRRFEADKPKMAALACENLVFRFESEDEVDGRQLFMMPHWLLKKTYTSVGVMFGKFWKYEEDVTREGARPIPKPPYHLLSVRNSILSKDPGFFQKVPELSGELLNSHDHGLSVWSPETGLHDIIVELGHFTEWDTLELYQMLSLSGTYERMKEMELDRLRARSTA